MDKNFGTMQVQFLADRVCVYTQTGSIQMTKLQALTLAKAVMVKLCGASLLKVLEGASLV